MKKYFIAVAALAFLAACNGKAAKDTPVLVEEESIAVAEAAPDVLIINPSLTDEEMLRELQQRLAHMEIAMEFTEDAVQLLANAPKTKQYGARPMKQYLAQMVENTIADKMLRSEVQSGDEICLTAKERRFVVLDKVLPTR